MKNIVIFDTYAQALRGAANAMKDGYNTVIHVINEKDALFGKKTYVNEYFTKESERFHDN